jgi:hypothetical protein
MAALKRIMELQKIENEYMRPRSNEFEVMIPEDTVVYSPGPEPTQPPVARSGGRMVMTANGFRLRR